MKKGLIINFSPNKNGTSEFIAKYIYQKLKKTTDVGKINVNDLKIKPCGSCAEYCFRYAKCKIKDDLNSFFSRLVKEDFIIIVTPVYFYHIPGLAKIMIDRSQPYWVKKYILKKSNLKSKQGFLIAVGATKGKKLFCGINLTIKYFFDIFNFKFDKKLNLYIRKVEKKRDVNLASLNLYSSNLEKLINYGKKDN
ncbi:MAG: flavodoxin family protein [Endomicrobia bacterium]|nr:flavodoxin family protein [Endomicrobiia bacterium]